MHSPFPRTGARRAARVRRSAPLHRLALLVALAGTALVAAAAFALAAVAAAPKPAIPVKLAPAAADSLTKALLADRAQTLEWLKSSPTSYLATVSRVDFGEKSTLTIGSDGDNDVRLQTPGVQGHHLRVTVTGDSFRVEAVDAGATFKVKDQALAAATLPPSSIGIDRFTVRLSHQRFPALIVFDPKSPRFAHYKGLEWYPVDLRWRFVAPLTPNAVPDTVIITSTRGNQRRALRVGWFDLRLAGKPVRIEAHRLLEPGVGEKDMSLFFRDQTTGRTTYGVGRYLEPEPLSDGRYVLDFNAAYNPACAVSEHYNCPIPSKANNLPVAITAGEKDAHYH